jgi:hypothetical protein
MSLPWAREPWRGRAAGRRVRLDQEGRFGAPPSRFGAARPESPDRVRIAADTREPARLVQRQEALE